MKLPSLVFSTINLGGGAVQALIPALFLIFAGQNLSDEQRGFTAVIVALSGFIAQLFFVGVIETRLTSSKDNVSVGFPKSIAFLGFFSGLMLFFFPSNFLVFALSLPLIFIALEVGRGVSLTQFHEKRENVATVILFSSIILVILSLSQYPYLSLAILGLGVSLTTLVRWSGRQPISTDKQKSIQLWLFADVVSTGAVYPILSLLVLTMMGANQAFVFAAITTAAGVIGIPVTYVRTRLLSKHDGSEIFLAIASILIAIISLILLEISDVLAWFFGSSYESSPTLIPLSLAIIWKFLGLWAVIPLTQLRRNGIAKEPTIARIIQSSLTTLIALLAIGLWNSLSLVFIVLCLGEILQILLYRRLINKLTK